jgi:hypothetical protein
MRIENYNIEGTKRNITLIEESEWIHLGPLFDVEQGFNLFDGEEYFHAKSRRLRHSYWGDYRLGGIYMIHYKDIPIYIGKGNSSYERGAIDRINDFRSTVLSTFGFLPGKQKSPYDNGLRFCEEFTKEDLVHVTAKIKYLTAGEDEYLQAIVAQAEVQALKEHKKNYKGFIPGLNAQDEVLSFEHKLELQETVLRPLEIKLYEK